MIEIAGGAYMCLKPLKCQWTRRISNQRGKRFSRSLCHVVAGEKPMSGWYGAGMRGSS